MIIEKDKVKLNYCVSIEIKFIVVISIKGIYNSLITKTSEIQYALIESDINLWKATQRKFTWGQSRERAVDKYI